MGRKCSYFLILRNLSTFHYRQRPAKQYQRVPHDFYTTPPEAIRALLNEVCFQGSIWEPACGNGAISKELKSAGYLVVSTDLIDRGYGRPDVDFLLQEKPLGRNIITNPPYCLANTFLEHSLKFTAKTGGTVAMLFNLSFLTGENRAKVFRHQPPSEIYVMDRIICWPNGEKPPPDQAIHFGKMKYCWMIWRPESRGRPSLWWLSAKEARETFQLTKDIRPYNDGAK